MFLAGCGFGHSALNGKRLYDNDEMHFKVTQGIRDRRTLKDSYPLPNKQKPAGTLLRRGSDLEVI